MKTKLSKINQNKQNSFKYDNQAILDENTLVTFDTNVLLELYNLDSEDEVNSFFNQIKSIKGDYFLPSQVVIEFFNNKDNIISHINKEKKEMEFLENEYSQFITNLEDNISNFKILLFDDIKFYFDEAIQILIENHDLKKENHKSLIDRIIEEDFILEKILLTFENKVTEDFTQDEINKIEDEGLIRYKKQIPPGYKDDNGKSKQFIRKNHINNTYYTSKFGDLILWKQIISYSKDKEYSNILLITNEKKSDWFEKKDEPKIYLLNELLKETDKHLIIKDFDDFITLTNVKIES